MLSRKALQQPLRPQVRAAQGGPLQEGFLSEIPPAACEGLGWQLCVWTRARELAAELYEAEGSEMQPPQQQHKQRQQREQQLGEQQQRQR